MKGLFISIAGILLLIGCPGKGEKTFQVPEDYRSWKKPVNKPLDYQIPGHGSSIRIMYANDTAFAARITKDSDGNKRIIMPDGSIIIKEAYKRKEDINNKIRDLTIMVKNSTDKNAMHGWLYYMQKPGKDIMRVDGRMCIGCHEAANEGHPYFDKNIKGMFRDYLFVPFVKQP